MGVYVLLIFYPKYMIIEYITMAYFKKKFSKDRLNRSLISGADVHSMNGDQLIPIYFFKIYHSNVLNYHIF